MKIMGRALIVLVAAAVLAACGGTETAPTTGVRIVTPDQAKALIAAKSTVIDVRSPAEFAERHVAGAINISVEATDFASRIDALDAAKPYVVYCRSGRRSAIAAALMETAGFTDVADAGGLDALVAAGVPTQ